jgi:hypothetical protein
LHHAKKNQSTTHPLSIRYSNAAKPGSPLESWLGKTVFFSCFLALRDQPLAWIIFFIAINCALAVSP